MSTHNSLSAYAGRDVRVLDPKAAGPLFMRVLAEGEVSADALEEFVGEAHPDGALEDGYRVIAVEGDIEDGEIHAGGFIAVHEGENRAYLCDSGTIRFFDGLASEIKVEPRD